MLNELRPFALDPAVNVYEGGLKLAHPLLKIETKGMSLVLFSCCANDW